MKNEITVWSLLGLAVVFVYFGVDFLYKNYEVWSSSQEGKAELSKADWNRQIIIKEAESKNEAAKYLASAEIERAKGVAIANKIIGESLKDNQDYLKYLWVNNLENSKNQVIYVPTETNLPILEANRLTSKDIK